jgi:EAL domain-containing protein (putative c-di-GMP-specific phosphodiesterase class I)
VQLSVNVSVRDLLDAGLAGTVEGELAALSLPPDVLLIEVSDRSLTSESIDIAAGVTALRGLGVRLGLDDFGTGYASLGRLRRLPVAEVKIDPSFVSGLAGSLDSQVIVRSVVDLVRGLGIRSVAEGVETAETAAALLALGCDAAQGYAFSRPLNAAAATAWLADDLATHPVPVPRPAPAARPAAATPAPVTSASAPEGPGR